MLLLIILVSTFFLNKSYSSTDIDMKNNLFIEKIKRRFYLENMVKEIETESEVKIPVYVDMKYVEYMYLMSKELEIPTRTTFRLVFKESCFVDTVVSHEGAYGFMQVMPKTRELYAERYGLDTLRLDENQKNIFIGMHMLKDWYEYWSETKGKPESYSWKLSLACYNAGIIKVMKYGGIPPYRETINYINFILKPSILNNNVNSNNFLATK